jgi:hypothetical protein
MESVVGVRKGLRKISGVIIVEFLEVRDVGEGVRVGGNRVGDFGAVGEVEEELAITVLRVIKSA